MKISGVVFDYGGVMTTSTMPQRVIELAAKSGIPWEPIEKGFAAHRLQYDGDFISLHELYVRIWRDAGLTVSEELTQKFMEEDSQSWLYRRERTREWMGELKARGFKIGILTNMCSWFGNAYFKKHFADYVAYADAMVISGEEHCYKPQPRIYECLRERIGLPAGELCFIDDVEKNVQGARDCGWQALRFESSAQIEADFEKLLAR